MSAIQSGTTTSSYKTMNKTRKTANSKTTSKKSEY